MALQPGTGPGPWKGHYGSPSGTTGLRDESGVIRKVAMRRLAGKEPNYRMEKQGQSKNFNPAKEEFRYGMGK